MVIGVACHSKCLAADAAKSEAKLSTALTK